MIGAWVLVAVIALAVVGVLLVPLRRRSAAPRRADFDLGVYRDQLGEVERDRERGLLTDDQAAAATVEIQRRILAVAEDDGGSLATSPGLSRGVVVGAAIAAPVAAVALYLVLGQPSLPDQPFAGRLQAGRVTDDPHSAAGSRGQQMEQLVGRLAERLLKQPNDVEGWGLLGRTYVTMNRLDDAVNAYRRALEISGNHPAVAADLGEVLITRAEGFIDIETQRLFEDALAADPRTVKARYYLGAAKVQAGDLKGAVDAWVDLIAVSPPNAPWVATVREQIGRAIEDLGIDPETLKPSPEALAVGPPPATSPATAPAPATTRPPGPSREDVKAAQDMSPEDRAQMIRGMVQRLADRLEENPNDREGWLRLGRAYEVLGEAENARQAFDKAKALAE